MNRSFFGTAKWLVIFTLIVCALACHNKPDVHPIPLVAGSPTPTPAPTPTPPLQDCRLEEDRIKKNDSYKDNAASYVLYALMSNNAYSRPLEQTFRLPPQWRLKEDFTDAATTKHRAGLKGL